MSKPLVGILAALTLCCAGGSQMVQAQTLYGNINQPAVSPYLNITRGPAAINYFGIVQPQLQFNSAINQLQAQQQQGGAGMGYADGSTTGHPIQFNNYSHFYPQRGSTLAGMAGQGGRGLQTSPFGGTQNTQYGSLQNAVKSPLGTAPSGVPLLQRVP